MTTPPPLAVEEFRALRATIRERGTLRLIVTGITVVAWAAAALAVTAVSSMPPMTLLPLAVLAAGFEVMFAIHVSVERIGRYLAVRYETADGALPAWEHAIAEIGGRAARGSGLDPLFSIVFVLAAAINLVPLLVMTADIDGALPGGLSVTFVLLMLPHAAFIVRVLRARRYAAGQRARDTELFQQTSRAAR